MITYCQFEIIMLQVNTLALTFDMPSVKFNIEKALWFAQICSKPNQVCWCTLSTFFWRVSAYLRNYDAYENLDNCLASGRGRLYPHSGLFIPIFYAFFAFSQHLYGKLYFWHLGIMSLTYLKTFRVVATLWTLWTSYSNSMASKNWVTTRLLVYIYICIYVQKKSSLYIYIYLCIYLYNCWKAEDNFAAFIRENLENWNVLSEARMWTLHLFD